MIERQRAIVRWHRATKRRAIWIQTLPMLLFVGFWLALLCPEGGAGEPSGNLSLLSSCDLYQTGEADLVLVLRGKELPSPDVSHDGPLTTVILRETRQEAPTANFPTGTPMVTSSDLKQVGRNIAIELVTERPLVLRSIRSYGDTCTLRLGTGRAFEDPERPSVVGGFNAPITLDLRDTKLQDVFRMMGARAQVNIIPDTSLPSIVVTRVLKDVPVSQAFEDLIKTYGLAWVRLGGHAVLVGTPEGIRKATDRTAGREETRAYSVVHGDSGTLRALLAEAADIPPDRISADAAAKKTFVTAPNRNHERAEEILGKLDRPARSILFRSRILRFADSASLDVRVIVDALYDGWRAAESAGRFSPEARRALWADFDAAFERLSPSARAVILNRRSVVAGDKTAAFLPLAEERNILSPQYLFVHPRLRLAPEIGNGRLLSLGISLEMGQVFPHSFGATGCNESDMPERQRRSGPPGFRIRDGEPFVLGRLPMNGRIPIVAFLPLLEDIFTYGDEPFAERQILLIAAPYIVDPAVL